MPEAKDISSAAAKRSGKGFELRLERGGAFVRLADQVLAPGVRLESLTLQIPDVKFPLDVGQGASQFRDRLTDLVELSVTLDASACDTALASSGMAAFGLEEPRIAARDASVELAGRLSGGPGFTLEVGFLPAGELGVALVFHSPRLLGPAPIPAAALPHHARAVLDSLGAEAFPREPLGQLLRRALVPRGWKLPRTGGVRLARAAAADGAVRIAWERDASGPAETSADPDLLAADEGARTFADAEALVARGDFAAAREAYLAAPRAAAHPFAAERLLSLCAHDERFHDEALDLAAEWLARRPAFAPALAAEAAVRLARGEEARAAHAFANLAAGAAERGRAFLALAAAEAAYAIPGAAPDDARRAAEVALSLRRDHVPALRAMRALARAAGDREALLRVNRRLVAYDPDPASKARAHAELGELLLEAEPPRARLHLEQALRLAPDDADALSTLARACATAREPLRAVRALDRLKELLLARGERARAAAVALEAGELWEGALAHPENALLRYREAADVAPSADAHARAARAAEKAGQWAEAADQHAAVLDAVDVSAPDGAALAVRTRLALADVAERLGDIASAATHLEKAAALGEPDATVLRRLAAVQRTLGRAAPLMATLDRLAALEGDPAARAILLAEAAEAGVAAGLAGDARARFTAAVAVHAGCRPALVGLARLAAERGDAVAERDALERLVPLSGNGAESAEILDRLALACERAGDMAAALQASMAARRGAPTGARLEQSLRLARLAGDVAALASLLAERARAAAERGDAGVAADAWMERARLLAASSPAQALAALAEARAVSPGDVAVLRAQTDLAEEIGEHRLALGALRALLAATADAAPDLELRAARAAFAAGEVHAAKEHAERALSGGAAAAAEILDQILERIGDDGARAEILGQLGRHLEAARLFERNRDARRARAALERAAADRATAAEALARLVELRLAEGDRPGAAEALLARARLAEGREAALLALEAHALGRDPAALDVAIEKDRRFAPPLARRAALRADGDPGAALADAEAALAGDSLAPDERAPLLALAARAAVAAGEPARARLHLAAYCEVSPEDDDALARLGALHRSAGAEADLEAVLERRLQLARGGELARVRVELSDLIAARDPARAARLALAAIDDEGVRPAALRAVTTPPRAAHVPPATRAALLAQLAADASATPEQAAAALGARAALLHEEGDAAGALEALRDAARLAPEADELVELRARVALAAGDRAEAAGALLERARRAGERNEPGAGDRLADAGLAALEAGVPGAEEALRAALPLRPERETARTLLETLVRLCRERGDASGEREALPLLVPLLPTGARAAVLLRLSLLALEGGNAVLARASAEEARVLAPRDLAAVEGCRAAALAQGDVSAVAALLAEAAALDRSGAGPRLLERARLLAAMGRAEEADAAYVAALAALPPDRALADEQARLRRESLPDRPTHPAHAPVEAFALRAADPRDAVSALRAAAALAFTEGDLGAALRNARGAFARTPQDLAFAGPLLARILYLQGGASEALELHRRLLDSSFPGVSPEEAVALCRQTADLAESAGDHELAVRALDALLRLRPQDLDAALQRFELEPDRARAARALAEAAGACRSRRRSALAFCIAAEGALAAGMDPAFGEELLRRALERAEQEPTVALAVARRRAEAIREREGASSPAFLEALHEAAAAAQAAGDRAAARDLLEQAIARERERGLFGEAARDLLQLDALAAADGDFPESAARLRAAAALQREAGDLAGATATLRGAYAANPDSDETFRQLEEVLRAGGPEAAPLLVELLADRAARAQPGHERAAVLLRLADAERAAGARAEAEAALRAALSEVPGLVEAEDRLLAHLAEERRTSERARLLLERAARLGGTEAADGLRREAAAALAASVDAQDREMAADAWRALASAHPTDVDAARAAAGLLVGLGRREETIPYLATLVGADPHDEVAISELATAVLASARMEDVLAGLPDHPAMLAAIAAFVAPARGDGAAAELDRRIIACAESQPEALTAEAEAPSRYRIGLALSFAGDGPGAIPHLERAVSLAPFDAQAGLAWAALAEAYAARGDAAGALAAARARLQRATTLGLEEEIRAARQAEADISAQLGLPAAGASEGEEAPAPEPGDAPAEVDAVGVEGWIARAEELVQGGAPADEIRAVLERASEADPDSPAPWRVRARLETSLGDPIAAARAHLSVSIRSDGDEAAAAALEAARLFEQGGHHADAARAYRAAVYARPDAVPESVLAMAEGRALEHATAQSAPLTLTLSPRDAVGEGGERGETASAEPSSNAQEDPMAVELGRQAAAASGPERADLLERLASHRDRAGDRRAAAEALVAALEADPGRDATFAWLAAISGGDADLLERAAAARASMPAASFAEAPEWPEAQPSAGRAEDAAAGDGLASSPEAAPEPGEHGDAGAPDDAFASWAAGEPPVVELIEEDPDPFPAAPSASEPRDPKELAREGRARIEEGDLAGAHERLSLAFAADPSDLTLARDLSRLAEKLGRDDEYVQLGEICADAIAPHDPLAAAARYRHFSEVLRDRVQAPQRAATMLEKALALVPDDADARRELLALWGDAAETAPRALDLALEMARRDPADESALAAVASACERLTGAEGSASLGERARVASSLAAFLSPSRPSPSPAPLGSLVPSEVRTRVAAPGAAGPLARLLELLGPWLEGLFPADLQRRGASLEDRIDASRAPAVAGAFDLASRALGARAHLLLVSGRSGIEVAIENTGPPAVILAAGSAALDEAALSFLAARTLDLVDHGWALVGKFAPKDVAILLELACRFAGGEPPPRGLPSERAGAFLAALDAQVPAGPRAAAGELATAASQELGDTDPRAFVAALRRTANRVGLLHGGDPGAALRTLALLDRRVETGALDPAGSLALPDLRDLAVFALSDPFLELRATVLGEVFTA